MSKNIIVVTGSPRTNGNSDALAEAFIEGAQESGKTVYRFNAGRMDIKGCLDCKYCFSHGGQCIQKDDMQLIYEALYKAEALVFVTPIYWYGFSAQLKAMIDRMYAINGKHFTITSTALLIVYGDTDTTVPDPIIVQYKAFTSYVGWKDKGIISQEGLNNKSDILDNKVLISARKLGTEI